MNAIIACAEYLAGLALAAVTVLTILLGALVGLTELPHYIRIHK